jgi:hypothetical protein
MKDIAEYLREDHGRSPEPRGRHWVESPAVPRVQSIGEI